MSDPATFKPGDIVRLKSGSVPMTVNRVGETHMVGWAFVQWFDGATLRGADFDTRQIVIAPTDECAPK